MVCILLVEDDDSHALLIQTALQGCDEPSQVVRVRTGTQALDYLRRSPQLDDPPMPSVILLDLNLPGMSGIDVLAQIKSDDRLKVIPVVVLTTSNEDTDRELAYTQHANSYVVKPTQFDRFCHLANSLVAYWGRWNHTPVNPSLRSA